jgi:hypothetical protein
MGWWEAQAAVGGWEGRAEWGGEPLGYSPWPRSLGCTGLPAESEWLGPLQVHHSPQQGLSILALRKCAANEWAGSCVAAEPVCSEAGPSATLNCAQPDRRRSGSSWQAVTGEEYGEGAAPEPFDPTTSAEPAGPAQPEEQIAGVDDLGPASELLMCVTFRLPPHAVPDHA